MPRMLLAEDGVTAMDLAGSLFDLPDLGVDVVTDGRSALDRVNAEPSAYDLVVLGHDLPEISGPECARFLRTMHRRVKVLLLVDDRREDLLKELGEIGIRPNYVQAKPIAPDAFVAWVQQALEDAPPRFNPN